MPNPVDAPPIYGPGAPGGELSPPQPEPAPAPAEEPSDGMGWLAWTGVLVAVVVLVVVAVFVPALAPIFVKAALVVVAAAVVAEVAIRAVGASSEAVQDVFEGAGEFGAAVMRGDLSGAVDALAAIKGKSWLFLALLIALAWYLVRRDRSKGRK